MLGDVVLLEGLPFQVSDITDAGIMLVPAPDAVVPVDPGAVAPPVVEPPAEPPPLDIVTLLEDANLLPDADDLSPGHLGQLISAVAYAYAGKPIRPGQKTLEQRIAELQERVYDIRTQASGG